ncbi:MAG: hypothetical protein AAB658_07335, partial [Chloroflexota bacterium]
MKSKIIYLLVTLGVFGWLWLAASPTGYAQTGNPTPVATVPTVPQAAPTAAPPQLVRNSFS